MNYKEFKKAVKKCDKVFAWTLIFESDGYYLEVKKKDVLALLNRESFIKELKEQDITFKAQINENVLYIN